TLQRLDAHALDAGTDRQAAFTGVIDIGPRHLHEHALDGAAVDERVVRRGSDDVCERVRAGGGQIARQYVELGAPEHLHTIRLRLPRHRVVIGSLRRRDDDGQAGAGQTAYAVLEQRALTDPRKHLARQTARAEARLQDDRRL